ncbi:glycosyltransferase family 2 protein [Nostoc sp.]|uniref:glycosyltransferase family 2 protein n=1 Tax=Nostoc sp. TaxID=1180 RepID=UPI002FFAD3AA
MKNLPLVSVIIPVYNCEKYLKETFDSVFAQTYRPIEVIVVDDGSTDESAKIAQTYPSIRYFYQSNQGAAIARNVGISLAEGNLIALLDADDVWQPNKLSLQVNYLHQHPQIGILATNIYQFLEAGVEIPSGFRPEQWLGEQPGLIPSTLVIRKAVFDKIGVFSPKFGSSEDTEWIYRARDSQVEIEMLSEVMVMRRLHGSNISWKSVSTSSSQLLRILKASIARKSRQIH